jgi:hypothetical protein
MKHALCVVALVGLCFPPRLAPSQEKAEPAASVIPKQVLHDDLLDKMVGTWRLSGKFEGQSVSHSVEVRWVLHHQFLEIHEKDVNPSGGNDIPYDARVYVGYAPASQRYVAHWLDVFGGGAETLGYGKRTGSSIEFDFEYPGQPWLTTFRWNAASNTWQWLMRTKSKQGQWQETADMTLARAGAP